MCDRIKEHLINDDESQSPNPLWNQAKTALMSSGCDEVNQKLTQCLEKNNRDFRLC